MVPETSAPKEHFKLVFGFGTSDPAKIRPLKVAPPAINWKSSLYENFHRMELQPRNIAAGPTIMIHLPGAEIWRYYGNAIVVEQG